MLMALDFTLLLFQIMQRSLSPYSVTDWAKLLRIRIHLFQVKTHIQLVHTLAHLRIQK